MIAIAFNASAVSSLPFSLVIVMVPILFLFVPQHLKRDKRTIALLAVLLALVLAAPVAAHEWDAVSRVCEYCPWWLCIECLIYG